MEKVLGEELWFWMVCANPTLRLPLEGVPPLRVPNPGAPCAPLCPSGTLLLFLGPIRSVLVTVTGLGGRFPAAQWKKYWMRSGGVPAFLLRVPAPVLLPLRVVCRLLRVPAPALRRLRRFNLV